MACKPAASNHATQLEADVNMNNACSFINWSDGSSGDQLKARVIQRQTYMCSVNNIIPCLTNNNERSTWRSLSSDFDDSSTPEETDQSATYYLVVLIVPAILDFAYLIALRLTGQMMSSAQSRGLPSSVTFSSAKRTKGPWDNWFVNSSFFLFLHLRYVPRINSEGSIR